MANTLPVAVPLATHGYGRPAIYYGNYNPSTHPGGQTIEMINLAEGSLFIQYGDLSLSCVETCVTAIWQKGCASDCDTAVWILVSGAGLTFPAVDGTLRGVGSVGNPIGANPAAYGPFGYIRRVGRIGMTAILEAKATPIVSTNGPLTYAWSGTGLTFSAPTAAYTNVTASAPLYRDFFAVCMITDINGDTYELNHKMRLHRSFEIGGPNTEVNNYYATLTAAIAWRDANDPGQHYTFRIASDTLEDAAINNLDNATVIWTGHTKSVFPASAGFVWNSLTPTNVTLSAEIKRNFNDPCLATTGGSCISLTSVVATRMNFTNLALQCTSNEFAFSVISSSDVSIVDCSWEHPYSSPLQSYSTNFQLNTNLTLERCTGIGNRVAFFLDRNTGRMVDCYGEITSLATAESQSAIHVANQDLALHGRFDISSSMFIQGTSGTTTIGLFPRGAFSFGVPAPGSFSGLTVSGCSIVNRVVGGPSFVSKTPNANIGTPRIVGCACVGPFLNVTPIAGAAVGQNTTIPS